jgi:NADH-quinone oxidoreductase subunit F
MVFDDSRNMMKAAHDAMAFFAHESCGKCFPCRIGTQRLTERLNGDAKKLDLAAWAQEVIDINEAMKATSALWTWDGCTPRHGITNEVFSRTG